MILNLSIIVNQNKCQNAGILKKKNTEIEFTQQLTGIIQKVTA